MYEEESGDWHPISDSTDEDKKIIITTPYAAISYRQSDFPNKRSLESSVRVICEILGLNAYWLDFACTGVTQQEKNEDLYRIADVFRNAKETIIMIPDNSTTSQGWKSWGERVWTYPEALLSQNLQCKEGKKRLRTLGLREVANLAYGGSEDEQRLVALYGTGGKDFSRYRDRIRDLCVAIWSRSSGPSGPRTSSDIVGDIATSHLTALPGERVYALMGFLQYRIEPNPEESEKQAFDRLMEANGLECDTYPWDGNVFQVRDKSERRAANHSREIEGGNAAEGERLYYSKMPLSNSWASL